MAYIKQYGSVILHRRDAWGGDTWASGGARWAFFAIFIVLILIVIFGTLRVNKKRSRQGVQPLYGTRWMTPPSYRQSQTQYDQPDNVRDPDLPSAYVPTYTAEANEYDMGYYDQSGKFHANPNAKAASMAPPPSAHQRQTSVHGDAIPISSTVPAGVLTDEDADISRPTGPPPGMDIVGSESNESLGDFYRPPVHTVTGSFIPPSGPPPGHSELREGSSSSSNIEASTINISDGINTKGSGKD